MKKKYKVHESHFSIFMYVYIPLRSVFGSASTGHNRQVSLYLCPAFIFLEPCLITCGTISTSFSPHSQVTSALCSVLPALRPMLPAPASHCAILAPAPHHATSTSVLRPATLALGPHLATPCFGPMSRALHLHLQSQLWSWIHILCPQP